MLCFIAELCVQQFPEADVYRLGGDEFLLISYDLTEPEITARMTGMNEQVEGAGYMISYGSEHRQSDFAIEDMVNCADEKMLKNKAEYYKVRDRRVR